MSYFLLVKIELLKYKDATTPFMTNKIDRPKEQCYFYLYAVIHIPYTKVIISIENTKSI
jgi:hypothetical protein